MVQEALLVAPVDPYTLGVLHQKAQGGLGLVEARAHRLQALRNQEDPLLLGPKPRTRLPCLLRVRAAHPPGQRCAHPRDPHRLPEVLHWNQLPREAPGLLQ